VRAPPEPTIRAARLPVASAAAELAARDAVLAGLVARHGPPPARRPVPVSRRFAALARAIVYQQLAGRAASAIHARLLAALEGELTPARVLAAPDEVLAGAGLSGAKAAALRDLAEKVATGTVDLGRLGRLPDDEVVARLVQVRGIGTWTAEMFLLAALGRRDVWPVGDYGVRVGFALAWSLPEVPSPAALRPLGEPFRPLRSLVAWYCWRAVESRTDGRDPGALAGPRRGATLRGDRRQGPRPGTAAGTRPPSPPRSRAGS